MLSLVLLVNIYRGHASRLYAPRERNSFDERRKGISPAERRPACVYIHTCVSACVRACLPACATECVSRQQCEPAVSRLARVHSLSLSLFTLFILFLPTYSPLLVPLILCHVRSPHLPFFPLHPLLSSRCLSSYHFFLSLAPSFSLPIGRDDYRMHDDNAATTIVVVDNVIIPRVTLTLGGVIRLR